MKKTITLFICAALLSVMLSACATTLQPTCPADKDVPTCQIERGISSGQV